MSGSGLYTGDWALASAGGKKALGVSSGVVDAGAGCEKIPVGSSGLRLNADDFFEYLLTTDLTTCMTDVSCERNGSVGRRHR